ncbi:MAG: AAA family ATPase [Acidimicrobiales bacterium]|nr:AAA family ATPase [Acidimicrobiales bacterium]
MTKIGLATQNLDFEARVRESLASKNSNAVVVWSEAITRGEAVAAVAEMAAGSPEVVVIGPGLAIDAALTLAEQFEISHPEIATVLVGPPTAQVLERALQAGARGVVSEDASPAEIGDTLERVLGAARRRRQALGLESTTRGNHVIPVLAAKGGSGKTTLATNLAVALAEKHPGQVILVDLDLQFGDVETTLGLDPDATILDAAALGEELTPTSLKAYLAVKQAHSLYALPAPPTPAEADGLRTEDVRRVLKHLRDEFRYVVVDTSAGLDEFALEALDVATELVLLTSMDVPSVRASVKELDALRLLGMERIPWFMVLNRATSKVGLSADDVELTLGRPVDVRIPSSRAVPTSVNQGRPLVASDPRGGASKAIRSLADLLSGSDDEQPQTHGWLRRGR